MASAASEGGEVVRAGAESSRRAAAGSMGAPGGEQQQHTEAAGVAATARGKWRTTRPMRRSADRRELRTGRQSGDEVR